MLKRLINLESRAVQALSIWTVYERSSYKRSRFLARHTVVDSLGNSFDADLLVSDQLADVRAEMQRRGLSCLARVESDNVRIVETWL